MGEEGILFGSVTAQMIADAVKAQADLDIDRRRIEIKKPIKTAGEHTVVVSLYRDIKAGLTLLVGDEDTFNPPAEEEEEVVEEVVEVIEEAAPEAAAE